MTETHWKNKDDSLGSTETEISLEQLHILSCSIYHCCNCPWMSDFNNLTFISTDVSFFNIK